MSERAVILLVDDDATIRKVATAVLAREGFQILAASDALEALTLARRHHAPIDLLLTDVRMPKMDGLQLASILHSEQPEMRIALMSGEYSSSGHLGNAAAFLRKPFVPATLRTFVRNLLGTT